MLSQSRRDRSGNITVSSVDFTDGLHEFFAHHVFQEICLSARLQCAMNVLVAIISSV